MANTIQIKHEDSVLRKHKVRAAIHKVNQSDRIASL
jgi:hypothetical protein